MNVQSIMSRQVVTVDMDDSLEHMKGLFETHRFHHLLVLHERKVVGVISDRDVLRHISPFIGKRIERPQDLETLKRRAHQLMTRALISVAEDCPIRDATQIMLDHSVSCLPVLDEKGHPRGIITWRDLLRGLTAPA